jgi:ComF family protein
MHTSNIEPKKLLIQLKKFLLDFLFPLKCIGCKKDGEILCEKCSKKIQTFSAPICFSCRKRLPLENLGRNNFLCHPKNRIQCVFVAANYSDPILKEVIQKYKYKNIHELNRFLSSLMIGVLENFVSKISPEEKNSWKIMPVPLHPKKEKLRGFNQSFLISKIVSEYFNIPLDITSLKRIKNTLPQAQIKNKAARLKNMEDAFQLSPRADLKNKNILLIDDILTTGATLEECAKALKTGGVKKIIAAVLAN